MLAALLIVGAIGAVWYWRPRPASSSTTTARSLAVLPLKSLDAGDNYLGLGIADAVIRRTSQTGGMIVRPTSAIQRYMTEDLDALTAARQLSTDVVLEGSVQRAGDRLRVSVNLLRVGDGVSLWADSFELRTTDIFEIQDRVAREVASHLQLRIDPAQQARLGRRPTTNPQAYQVLPEGTASARSADVVQRRGEGRRDRSLQPGDCGGPRFRARARPTRGGLRDGRRLPFTGCA